MKELICYLIGLGAGVLISYIIYRYIFVKRFVGCIHMDSSDPEERPYLFLDLNRQPESLANMTFVVCKVDPVDISTQDSQRL